MIQDELGDSNASEREADTYRERIEALPIADEQKVQLRREINRLGQLSPSSSDYAVIKGHLDTVFQLPWTEKTDDRLDLKEAEASLEEKHFGLEKVKERVLEFLAVLKLKGDLKGPILCFAGPPGVGKTSLGAAIAAALGRKFVRMAVGGVTDESEIRGHRKTYIGAMPGKLIQSYIQVGVNNPLIMIDEIDKIGKDYRGDPASALLEVLDPKQNHTFVDRYLEIPYDLSHTLFICTANVLDTVPTALRDRMEVIRLSGYTETEKLQIAKKHLIPELLDNHGLTAAQVTISDDAILATIRDYTAEAGVRNLERKLATGLRKIASGRVVVGGRDVSHASADARLEEGVGHIPEDRQRRGLVLEFSLAENIALHDYASEPDSKLGWLRPRVLLERARRLLKEFDVRGGGPQTRAGALSGGNQQKLVVGREVDRDPKVLIAAQPTRGLDVGAIEYMHRRLVEERDEGRAILLVSLELEEVLALSDRILVIYEGQIVAEHASGASEEEIGLEMLGAKRQEAVA